MRLLLYDEITTLDKGDAIIGSKSFSLADECLRGHFSRTPLVPGVMFIEAMAQLLGWLVIYSRDFTISAVMSLVEDVDISSQLRPGFKAEIHGKIVSTSRNDSLGSAHMFVEGRLVASVGRIIYIHSHRADRELLERMFRYYSGWEIRA